MLSHHYREQVAKTTCGAVGLSEAQENQCKGLTPRALEGSALHSLQVGCLQHTLHGADSAFLAWGLAARNIPLSASSHQAAHTPV